MKNFLLVNRLLVPYIDPLLIRGLLCNGVSLHKEVAFFVAVLGISRKTARKTCVPAGRPRGFPLRVRIALVVPNLFRVVDIRHMAREICAVLIATRSLLKLALLCAGRRLDDDFLLSRDLHLPPRENFRVSRTKRERCRAVLPDPCTARVRRRLVHVPLLEVGNLLRNGGNFLATGCWHDRIRASV